MSVPSPVEPPTDDPVRHVARLLPLLALFVRASIGLNMLNSGLIGIFSKNLGRNLFNNGAFGGPGTPPGSDALAGIFPYAELAVSVGLIFGIFTTISAFLACAISLIGPLLTTLSLVTSAGLGPAMNQNLMGFNLIGMLSPNTGVVAYVLLVAISPLRINRFSIDALIFQRNTAPIPRGGVDPVAEGEIPGP